MALSGKTCIVTGWLQGIGKGICLELAHNGANVIVNYISDEKAAKQVV